jgi:HlyD family secretion protein
MSDSLTDVLPGLSRGVHAPSRKRTRRILWGIGLALCVGSLAVWRFDVRHRVAETSSYQTSAVTRGPLSIAVTAVGTLQPDNVIDVGSELSGIVNEVLVEVNDTVTEGQPLARLDDSILRSQERLARAQAAAASAAVEQANVTVAARALELERARKAGNALPAAQLDAAASALEEAKAALKVASARLQESQASLASARTNLAKSTIVAPIDGIVLERNVEPGQSVVSALQAATLFRVAASLAHMQVDVDVDEADVGRVRPGLPADFTVAAWPDRLFDATVTRVHQAPVAALSVVSYRAELAVSNPEGLLLPGMTATAHIQAERLEDAVLVPNSAMRFQPSDSSLPPPEAKDGRRRVRVWQVVGSELEPVEVVPLATDGTHTAIEGDALEVGAELAVATAEPTTKKSSAPPHP